MSTETKHDFFISFSNQDVKIVSKIVDIMDNIYHAKCWFQTKDSKAEFVPAIIEGIENAKTFLVFVSPDSSKSFYVLNEINRAIEWKQEHDDYTILPIVIGPEDIAFTDPAYSQIRFCLGRINMLFLHQMPSIEHLVLKIFEQTGYEIADEELRESLYYVNELEAIRLKSQNEIMKDFSKEFFDSAVNQDSLILDVGCASGNYIMSQLEGRQYKGLLGIDSDETQTNNATELYGSEKNQFLRCDALSDELDDVLDDYLADVEERGFDLIHISSLILHIAEPVKLLRLLRRYLKKDGQLFIQDEDDGANVVYPNSKFFDLAFKIWADSKESGDRHCARKIPAYLAEAGYKRVRLAKCGVSNPGMDSEHQSAFWDIYFNHHLWVAAEEDMFYNLKETSKWLEEYKSLYDEYKKQYDDGNIFIQLGFFFFIAQK